VSRLLSHIYRVEIPAQDRSGSSETLPRFVVMVDIPDCAISEFENPGPPELLAKQSISGSKSQGKRFGVVTWEEIVAAIEKEWVSPGKNSGPVAVTMHGQS
jgi:hypothetical protein